MMKQNERGRPTMEHWIEVTAFGAVGDGAHDDTAAVQAAIDEGARTGQTVWFGPGRYRVGELTVRPGSVLKADPQWGYSYDTIGKSVLVQRDEAQRCILNLSHANGATLDGLSLTGEGRPGGCCGILADRDAFGKIEDAYRIERCRAARFSGHAVYLNRVWCFTARHNMFCFSGGDGLRIHGWDGFVSDNWFSGNAGAGFGTEGDNCSVTMTGNRIEWNRGGGIMIAGGSHYNITGNYIDRSGKAGIACCPADVFDDDNQRTEHRISNTITITGNIVYRSGKFAEQPDENCHLLLRHCAGVTATGNTFCVGRDDKGKGQLSPKTGMILDGLKECIVANNTLFIGALDELIHDCGNHSAGTVIVENNVGSLYPVSAVESEEMGLPTNIILDHDADLRRWFQ